MKHTTKARQAVRIPGALAAGGAASMALTLVLSLVLAWMVDKGHLPWEQIGYGILALLLICAFAGALVGYHQAGRQRLAVCLGCGGVYFLLLLAATALFFGGTYHAVGVSGGLILAGSGCAGLLAPARGRAGVHKKRRHVPR